MLCKIFAVCTLLLVLPALAQKNSAPFIGIALGISNNKSLVKPIEYRSERMNIPLEASLGYEFYLSEAFRPSLAFVLGRGGWDWEKNGEHGGSVRYIYPVIDLNLALHDDNAFAGIAFFYGLPKLTQNIYIDDSAEFDGVIWGISPSIGFKIYDHYRVVAKYRIGFLDGKPEQGNFSFKEDSYHLGAQYVF
jgi:hypothetical protein